MKKRIVSLLMTMLLVLTFFAGCGTGESTTASVASGEETADAVSEAVPETTETPEEASVAEEASVVEGSAVEELPEETDGAIAFEEVPVALPISDEPLTYSMYVSISPVISADVNIADSMALKELSARTNINIEYDVVSSMSYNEQFMLMIAGGDWTDVLMNVSTTYSGGLGSAISEDVILDLSEYEEYMPNYSNLIRSDVNIYRDVTLGDGEIGAFYGVYNEEKPVDAGLLVRGDWLDKLGLDVPETIDDYYEMLKAFNSEYGAVMHLPTNGELANQAFLSAYDVAGFYIDAGFFTSLQCYTVEDGQVICGFMEDGFKQYLQLMNTFYSEGLISGDYMSATSTSNYLGDNSDALSDLLNDKIGLWGDSVNTIINYDNTNSVDPDFRAQPVPFPVLNEGDTLACGTYTSVIDEAYMSISTACDNVGPLVQYIDYCYTAEGSALMSWGVEGETYVVNDDGSYSFTDLVLNNPDWNVEEARFVYLGMGHGSYLKDIGALYAPFNDTQMECFEVWNSNFTGEHSVSKFLAMTTDESNLFGEISGDIITYLSECVSKFIVGEMNFEEDYDFFLEQMQTLRVDELTQLEQTVYDRWASTTLE